VAAAAPGGSSRPFSSSAQLSGTFNTDTGSFVLDGTLIGTHLGKSTVHAVGNVATGTGTSTITAANGDELILVADGPATDVDNSVCPPDLQDGASQQPSRFIGGTGRFAGATGQTIATTCIRLDGAPPNLHLTVATTRVGTISY
jgi:hypothetical protein